MRTDVAVLGGGPAGSTAAAFLAKSGANVVLVNREEFPRDKLCGEFLSYDALPILDALGALESIDRAGAVRIESCRLVGDSGAYEVGFPHIARGISRLTLDSSLFQAAVRAGATPMAGWTADRIDRRGERFAISLSAGDRPDAIDASIVLGAWGRWGRIDQQLDRPFIHDRTHRYFGFKRHYSGPPLPGRIDLYSFAAGYLGASPIEGGLTNLCGLVHHERLAGMRGGWSGFAETLAGERSSLGRLFGNHTPVQAEFLSSDPVIFSAKTSVQDGIIMIGDAAGQLDPLTGNGMAMGIQSGLLAATAARDILSGADRAETLARYARRHRELFAKRIAWSRRVAFLLCRPQLADAAARFVPLRAPGELLLRRTRAEESEIEQLLDAWRGRG